MNALDANVLARFFIDDAQDPEAAKQRPAAVAAVSDRACVPMTVLLEFEWAMRGFYGLPRADVARVLQALCSLEHITLEGRDTVLAALVALGKGLDFADALHLAGSAKAAAFATFDRALVTKARRAGLPVPVTLLG